MDTQTKTALVPIADHTEELEAVAIIDTLRRAGINVTVASVGSPEITASRGVKIVADTTMDACAAATFDLIVLPGGMPGADHLAACKPLIDMLKAQKAARRLIGAICAAPAVVLKAHQLLDGITATCYPSFQDRLEPGQLSQEPVVADDSFITAQGPGVAVVFALTLVDKLLGPKVRAQVAEGMIVTDR